MKRYKLVIEYNGARFFGSQKQENLRTVQNELENVLSRILNCDVSTIFSGRTDKGVHALAQVAVFDGRIPFELVKFIIIANKKLPLDIRILSIDEVDFDFNPRFSSKLKTYLFKIKEMKDYRVFDAEYYYFVDKSIENIEKFNEILQNVVGTHDFTSFKKSDCTNHEVIKKIYSANLMKIENEYHFEITGSGFLKNMVRIILEESLREYYGKESAGHIKKRIDFPSIEYHKHLAPPQGLYLKEVKYD